MTSNRFSGQPEIRTARLVLRPLRGSDAGLLTLYAGDRRVAWNTTTIPHPLPPGAAEEFIAESSAEQRKEDVWAMDGSAYGLPELLGVVGLERMGRSRCELGYWVARDFRNAGLASESVGALLTANPLRTRKCFAMAFRDNPASERVLFKAGFEFSGVIVAYSVARGSEVAAQTYLKNLVR